MTCSIIIVNHNTRELLRQLLLSVAKHLHDLQYEVIVVDNASTDGSRDLASEFAGSLPLKWVNNDKNQGFAVANNQAIRLSTGEFVLLLNSDTVLLDDSIARFVRQIESMPEVAIAGCRLLNADHSLQRSCGIRPSLKTELYNKLLLDRCWRLVPAWGSYHLSPQSYDEIQEVEWVTGACMLIRRSALDRIGLLDENIYLFYEDVDLCLRARQAGYRVVYSPVASVVHVHGGTWKRKRKSSILNDAWSALYFHQKHSGKAMTFLLRALIVFQNLMRLGLTLLPSLILRDSRGERYQQLEGYAGAIRLALVPMASARRFVRLGNEEVPVS